ncbi:alpha/beta hydrolase [Nocardia asteroides]|uniref:alpha/beta hydrolase n=1 Tax=Nocardia asteroides TaxID=1824 RepID=UPI00055CDF99|nr:alpha/beta hydrolase family protein [Nocardia asteroides]TLF69865.1 esterase family protein [Nocardia asteroides NBRC 15531]UGT49369.1 esterase family protein [Nocardia asteroides]
MTASRLWLAVVCAIVASLGGVQASADPGARVAGEAPLGGRAAQLDVYSPAMGRVIQNRVIKAAGPGAPTLYLLTGAGGGADGISWWDNTDVRQFFADKYVNVVMPVGGAFTLYTDWIADDPGVGRVRWETYLTRELPEVIDDALGASGRNAIAGVSMSASSALDLTIRGGSRFAAVAALSGCPWAADPLGITMASAQAVRGGGNPGNMWGLPGGDVWREHDVFANAGGLAGKTVFLSAATGIPGANDAGLPFPPLESIAGACTAAFAGRLGQLGIPATYVHRPTGSHTWGQFQADLHEAWPHLAAAIGA